MKDNNDISFLGRVFLAFKQVSAKLGELRLVQRFKSRQRELSGYVDNSSPVESKISFTCNIIKVWCITAFCILLVAALIFGGSIFTYENVYYMFKDISYITDYSESRAEMLSYSQPVRNQDFADFKGGLATVSDSEIKFFTSTGRVTLTLGSEYTDPKIVTGGTKALIFDSGKSSFSIYNSFICEYTERLDYPISSADVSDSGSIAVVTRGKSYSTAVRVYDNDFSLLTEYSKNDYIVSAKLSSDGKFLAVISLDAENGSPKSTLSVLKVGSSELYSTVTVDGAIPYSCDIMTSDRIAAFFNDRVVVYNMKGAMISEYYYPGEISAIASSEKGFTLVFDEKTASGASMLAVFDQNGNAYTPKKVTGNVREVAMRDGYVYLLFDDKVVRMDITRGIEREVETLVDNARLTVINTSDVLLCTSASAYYISFD